MQFTDYRVYVAIAVGLALAALLLSLAVERSRFGMSLLAIKQNEPAAEAAGIDTLRWKMRAIVLERRARGGGGRPSTPWCCWSSPRTASLGC